jgi:hypothetical protein
MNKINLYAAIAIQLVVFNIMFYIDAKNTVEPLWKNVLHFGLNPLVLAFFALTPLLLWWTYRVIYQYVDEQFWYASLIHALIFQVAFVGSSYLATRQVPSTRNWLSLALNLVAVFVSA